jgi:hypothetical protein
MVAGTLIQAPHRYIDIADPKWDENSTFIADFIMADSSDRMP